MPAATVTEPESAILMSVADGDRAAFNQLYDRLQPRVLGLAMRILRGPIMRRMSPRRSSSTSGNAREPTTAARAAQRDGFYARPTAALSTGCSPPRRANYGDHGSVFGTPTSRPRTSRIPFHRVWKAGGVERELGTLPETQRQGVALARLGGNSHSEVPAILKVPVGTVRTRIRAGIGRLHDELAAAWMNGNFSS